MLPQAGARLSVEDGWKGEERQQSTQGVFAPEHDACSCARLVEAPVSLGLGLQTAPVRCTGGGGRHRRHRRRRAPGDVGACSSRLS